jgi:VWFA-related protein
VQLITRLLPEDKALVGAITHKTRLVTSLTNDTDTLIRALWTDIEPGLGTSLWQGLHVAMSAIAPAEGRRVVLVLSDGWDTTTLRRAFETPVEELMLRSQAENVMIYAIGVKGSTTSRFGGPAPQMEPHPALRDLARGTGGGYFELLPEHDLGEMFARVADELHRQYELGYTLPTRDGRVHRIEVRLARSGLTARARPSYVAPSR